MPDPARRVEQIREQLRKHDYDYFVRARPTISDREYDALMRQLRELEEAHPELVRSDSPTQRVGGVPIEGFEHVTHAVPMLSVDNTYSADALREFDGRVRKILEDQSYAYMIDPKVDGVAASIRYEDGRLTLVASRGDGRVGDDITHTARTIRAIPLRLWGDDVPAVLEVRGEIYWPLTDFQKCNARRVDAGEAPFANPRNATAGTLKQLDPSGIADRGLSFVAHGFGQIVGAVFDTHSVMLDLLGRWGIPASPYAVKAGGIDAVLEVVHEWDTRRHDVNFLMDGLVIKIDDCAQRDILGETSKYPRWCIAYKFAAEQAQTVVHDISLQVGKLGTVTPVADLEPVLLAGTTVKRASLHNFDQVERLDVRVGDTVIVEKAGEIIPQVVEVVKGKRKRGARRTKPPTKCPSCAQAVVQDEGGVYLRCTNSACPAKMRERLVFFCGRGQMDIDGAGPAMIDQLLAEQLIVSYADLYRLDSQRQQMIEMKGYGEKSIDALLTGIAASKSRPLERVLASINIQHIGATTAGLVADAAGDIDRLMAMTAEELQSIDGVGPELATSLRAFFDSPAGQAIIADLRAVGVNMIQPRSTVDADGPLKGATVVVTGTLEHFGRKDIENYIKHLGGKTSSSVSKKTTFVVYGDKAGSKLEKAEKLKVETLDEQAFIERFGQPR